MSVVGRLELWLLIWEGRRVSHVKVVLATALSWWKLWFEIAW